MAKEIDFSVHPDQKFNFSANNDYFSAYVHVIGKKPTIKFKRTNLRKRFDEDSLAYKALSVIDFILGIFITIVALIRFPIQIAKYKKFIAFCAGIEAEIDKNIQDCREDIKQNIVKRLHINPNDLRRDEPIIIGDYVMRDKGLKFGFGTDNILRTNKYKFLVLICTVSEIVAYEVRYNLATPTQCETTTNIFYQDIDSFRTEIVDSKFNETDYFENNKTIEKGKNKGEKSYDGKYANLYLTTTGSNSISISVREINENVDASIKAIRMLLREKKESTTDLLKKIIDIIKTK